MDLLEKDPMSKFFPQKGWLKDYVEYSCGGWPPQREMPPRFNLFAGLSVLGGVVRRKIYFEKENKLFPNLYVMLVSQPGVGKKTTAINYAEDVLSFMSKEKPNIIPSKITTEDLLRMLSVKPEVHLSDQTVDVSSSGQFFCSELSVLIGKQQYLIGLPQILIDLYDCPEIKEVSTIKHGKWVLKNVFLNLLGGATTEGLQEAFPKEALTQGLLSRFLLIIMPEIWEYRNPRPPRKNIETRLKLAQQLEAIASLRGEITWNPEADRMYCDWYMSRTITKDVGYFEREPDHVIKLCILLQIAQDKKFEITPEVFQQAIDIASILAGDVTGYLPTLRAEPSGQRSAKVLRKLIELGGEIDWIPHSTLMSKCWYFIPGRSMEFSEIIQFLKEINVLKSEAKDGTVLYKALESDIWTKSQIKKEVKK